MSWPAARAALDARLILFPGLDPLKVAWPNRKFPADINTPMPSDYWKIDLLPAGVDPVMSGADHENGIYQITRFVQMNGGLANALVDVQSMVDWFKKKNLSGVACGVPVPAPPIPDDAWFYIPISIPFQVL